VAASAAETERTDALLLHPPGIRVVRARHDCFRGAHVHTQAGGAASSVRGVDPVWSSVGFVVATIVYFLMLVEIFGLLDRFDTGKLRPQVAW
jgi:hypothetical protein